MVRPLLKDIHCIEEPNCEYPVAVRLAMEDGSVMTYTLENAVSPKVLKAQNLIEESIHISIGYQYGKKRRNRSHRSER